MEQIGKWALLKGERTPLGGFAFITHEDNGQLFFDKIMLHGQEKSVKPVRIHKNKILAYGTYDQYKKVKKMMDTFTQKLTDIDNKHKEKTREENQRYAGEVKTLNDAYTQMIEKALLEPPKKIQKH